jgi:hypothetical protein
MASQATGGWFFALQSPQSRFPTLKEVCEWLSQDNGAGEAGSFSRARGTVLLKVCDVGLASLVRDGVDITPPGGDEPEVPAAVFPLDKGAHGVFEEAVTRRR